MPTKEKKPLFSWREAVLRSDLNPTTRHVLLTLACHMNDLGEGCFPSMDTISEETGLHRVTVVEHVKIAVDGGWVEKTTHGFSGRKWRRNEYKSTVPDREGCSPGLQPNSGEVVVLDTRGSSPGLHGVVVLDYTSTSENSSKNTSSSEVHPSSPQAGGAVPENPPQYGFKDFWNLCPDRWKSRKQESESREIWNNLNGDSATKAKIVQYVGAMCRSAEWGRDDGRFSLAPKTILSNERWRDPLPLSALYFRECESVRDYFLEATGQPESTNKLTPDRLDMLAHRVDEARRMKLDVDPESERSLMRDAVDTCLDSPYFKKRADQITLESVFGTAEKFEKLIKREPVE